jgi:hypothetical protein
MGFFAVPFLSWGFAVLALRAAAAWEKCASGVDF